MRQNYIILIITLVILTAWLLYGNLNKKESNLSSDMKILSPVFENGAAIPSRYTCDGENFSPPLIFIEIPEKALELVLIMDDPDAPRGTWVHWTAWGIQPKTSEVPEGAAPIGSREGMTSFGETCYGGPCPHSGSHRYFFKLYALSEKLNLAKETKKEGLEAAMKGKILAEAELMGTYVRK